MPAPSYDVDFYSDSFIRDPWHHYAAMRALGPLVWLPQHGNYAFPRYQEVADCLRDPETFCSGRGVAADKTACDLMQGNSIASDGERHAAIRTAMAAPLLPGALGQIKPLIEALAEDLIDTLLERAGFDVISDLASHLPLTIVRDLVGLPDFGKDNMLRWGAAAFDLLGVQNPRGQEALNIFLEQRAFIREHATREALKEGSWTRRIHELVDDGALSAELAPFCIRDYINPSLDTTISATGQLIWQLARHPEEWERLQEHPELIGNAVNEAVRLASPIRSFSRHATRDVSIGDAMIEKGSRVMVLYASANRDERAFDEPDAFRTARDTKKHLGFGSGIHMCVGMHLAQLEMASLLKAMLTRVKRIHVGQPTVGLNNTIHSFAALPARFERSEGPVAVRNRERAEPQSQAPDLIRARIVECRDVADDVLCLTLSAGDGAPLPPWAAGAHIDVHVRAGLVRQYSLTGRGGDGLYRIAVQKDAQSRGGSLEIHRRYREGGEIRIGQPRNHFPLDDSMADALLFSGGIGMTPILAMAWRLHALGRHFRWHLSARSITRLPFLKELDGLPFRDRIFVHLDDDDTTSDLDAAGALHGAGPDCHVYTCGPRGYMAFIEETAKRKGIASERYHQEHFGAEIDVAGDVFTVVAARSRRSVEVGAKETIYLALKRVGIEVETSCQNGVCGSCLTPVMEGRPDHRDMVLTDIEKAANERIAVCCSRSQTKVLTLDL